jgi:hypothetical protein
MITGKIQLTNSREKRRSKDDTGEKDCRLVISAYVDLDKKT